MPINDGIERAHRHGILTAASLMVGAPAAADAVERARRLPSLRVGLHVTVVRGRPLLPPDTIPDLVDDDGQFRRDLVRAGFRFFGSRAVRAQLEAEIGAQFEQFRRSGLELDHADAHCHMHVHPTVFATILRVGRAFGLRAIRIPREPWRLSPARAILLAPWVAMMRARARRAGLMTNDVIFGMTGSGHMTAGRVLRILDALPAGVSELYLHPASDDFVAGDPMAAGYEREAELAALTSAEVAEAIRSRGIVRTTFGEFRP